MKTRYVALLWLILGALSVTHSVIESCTGPAAALPGPGVLLARVAPYALWALLTPVVFLMARRYPIGRQRLGTLITMHVAVALAVVTFAGAARAWMHDLTVHAGKKGHQLDDWLAAGFLKLDLDLFIYAALLATIWVIDAWRVAQERRVQLVQARLQALQMQIQPHFLFNTLNTVSALVESDPDQTRRVVARLSDMLRRVLGNRDEQETTLADELQFVRAYLEIEQVRFGERLDVRFDIEPRLERALVPALILQPLVENAIRHAIALSPANGWIEIRAFARDHALVLQVRDSGAPAGARSTPGHGMALENTRQRLHALGGSFSLAPIADAGYVAEVLLPLQLERQCA